MAKINKVLVRSLLCLAAVVNPTLVNAFEETAERRQTPDIKFIKPDNITNQIPYFDHRFRIDAQLDEVTLLFYRKSGAPPIILVRPDGSKLKIGNAPKDKVEWFDDRTFDLIKIKKPMPGPWQAVGDILPDSQIMVLSDVRIEVDPLPAIVLSGETLKVTGKLFNGEDAIDTPNFKDVVTLDVDFYSTNNSEYDNFGAEPIQLATFADDGHDLDEYANDNIFTGEFVLDFAAGEWLPIYQIKLPMATRQLRQAPIVLQKSPVEITVDKADSEGTFHKVNLNIDANFVDPDSMVFQGTVTFPDRQDKEFSIIEGSGEVRIEEFEYTEPGIHRVNVNAYGKTIEGREFRLVVPEFAFNVDHKIGELAVDENGQQVDVAEIAIKQMEENAKLLEMELEAAKAEEEKKEQEMMAIIIGGNVLIILIAVIAFFVFRWRKRKQAKDE